MSTAINMYLNQISLTEESRFRITLPQAPDSVNVDAMTDEELYLKLKAGYADAKAGRVQDADAGLCKISGGTWCMIKYTVKISDKAQADMEQIYSYIAKELMSPRNCPGSI